MSASERVYELRTPSILLSILLLPVAQADGASEAEDVFAKVSESVVVINRYTIDINTSVKTGRSTKMLDGRGSGVVVAPERVLTNCHVVLENHGLTVHQKDRVFRNVRLEYFDKERDMCQLHVRGLDLPVVGLGDSQNLRTGQRVYAIGTPEDLEQTLSEGIISSPSRVFDDMHYIQTTAAISAGSSGGGLFDVSGRLIGLTTSTLIDGQNLNFAIPIHWLNDLPERFAVQRAEMEKRYKKLKPLFDAKVYASARQDWKAMIQVATEYIEIAPDDATGWDWLGEGYAGDFEFEKAFEAFQKSLAIEEDSLVWLKLGEAYTMHGMRYQLAEKKPDLAEREFRYAESSIREALRMDPELPGALKQLGIVYYHQRRLNLALEVLSEAVRLYPDDSQAWGYLGSTYSDNGQDALAAKAFQREKEIHAAHEKPKYIYGESVPLKESWLKEPH
jgi:hypothetical protein